MVGICGAGLWCWSQSVKGTELGRGLHERGLMLLRYDTRFESAHWNDVVGEFEDLEYIAAVLPSHKTTRRDRFFIGDSVAANIRDL